MYKCIVYGQSSKKRSEINKQFLQLTICKDLPPWLLLFIQTSFTECPILILVKCAHIFIVYYTYKKCTPKHFICHFSLMNVAIQGMKTYHDTLTYLYGMRPFVPFTSPLHQSEEALLFRMRRSPCLKDSSAEERPV